MNSRSILYGSEDEELVELKTKITQSGIVRIPQELKEVFGHDVKIITSTTAALILCPLGISNEDVIRSLEIIKADLEFRMSQEKAKAAKKPTGRKRPQKDCPHRDS